MTGTTTQAALSLLSAILALLPSPHLQESLKALLLLHGHGKARSPHSKTKSSSALSRFLNRYPWPTRALIRLARKEAPSPVSWWSWTWSPWKSGAASPTSPSPSFTASGASTS